MRGAGCRPGVQDWAHGLGLTRGAPSEKRGAAGGEPDTHFSARPPGMFPFPRLHGRRRLLSPRPARPLPQPPSGAQALCANVTFRGAAPAPPGSRAAARNAEALGAGRRPVHQPADSSRGPGGPALPPGSAPWPRSLCSPAALLPSAELSLSITPSLWFSRLRLPLSPLLPEGLMLASFPSPGDQRVREKRLIHPVL